MILSIMSMAEAAGDLVFLHQSINKDTGVTIAFIFISRVSLGVIPVLAARPMNTFGHKSSQRADRVPDVYSGLYASLRCIPHRRTYVYRGTLEEERTSKACALDKSRDGIDSTDYLQSMHD